ncbi:MAG: MFS transporter [Paracoccaceae bacterium]
MSPLRVRAYRHLFAAQVLSLIGTGLATVALGLLAYELAGEAAGQVLGTALFIKMVAYVTLSPVAGAVAGRLPRRGFLIALDLLRAAIVLVLPFMTEIWQVYVLIALLQAASAFFTPIFQATIPEILPDEATYTRALSLARLAYDTESLLSPGLAALALTVMPFHMLFLGTSAGFVASALLVLTVTFTVAAPEAPTPFIDRLTRGLRRHARMPVLRGLIALNLAAAAGSAYVIVNTVPIIRGTLGRTEADVALMLAAYGAGSMAVALIAPRLIERIGERALMLGGGFGFSLLLAFGGYAMTFVGADWGVLLPLWAAFGAAYSAILTPGGRLLRRAGTAAEFPAIYAAYFALSHACWLLTYPLAGYAGVAFGLGPALLIIAALALLAALAASRLWPA